MKTGPDLRQKPGWHGLGEDRDESRHGQRKQASDGEHFDLRGAGHLVPSSASQDEDLTRHPARIVRGKKNGGCRNIFRLRDASQRR